MSANKNIIASLLLVFFSLIQIADLHVLDHDVNDVNCKICQFASDHRAASFLPTLETEVPQTLYVYNNVVSLEYHTVFHTETRFSSLQNKAPPVT